ncbi:MAG: proline--tRNA ligase [Candidatus Baldrarchaeia archaeon]
MEKEEAIDKLKNFSEWFRTVITVADLVDTRYPVKGCYVWRPYGFKLRKYVLNIIRRLLDNTGHEEVLFPLLIPEDILGLEKEHIKGFEGEVYWVTHGGLKRLEKKLALRPTSETAMYNMFKKWIHSHADLPIKVYQIVNIFRYETKATRPLIRVREVTTFKEAHTVHETAEEAEKQVKEAIEIYSKFFDELGIPYIICRRPNFDKFAGAEYSVAFDTLMPDGRTMQIGTVHNLGQNFAKAFEITYEDINGKHQFAYQTCYGISERAIAALVAIHGDNRGAIFPPSVAPIQVVIVPIIYKGEEEKVLQQCRSVLNTLKQEGIRTFLDERDISPGRKFYDWEFKGVPVRIEIGPKDVANNQVTIVRRDTFERNAYPMNDINTTIKKVFADIEENLRKRAKEEFKKKIFKAKSLQEAREIIQNRRCIALIPWCGSDECGMRICEEVDGDVLGTVLSKDLVNLTGDEVCPICNKRTKSIAAVAKTY